MQHCLCRVLSVLAVVKLSTVTASLSQNAKVAEAEIWPRQQATAEDAFCPLLSAAARVNKDIVDMMRAIAFNTTVSPSRPGGRVRWTISSVAQPIQSWRRLFQQRESGEFSAGSCAVVSSSGVLLNHSHGAEIDAADVVIRFNDAEVTADLAQFVGTREDIRILNDEDADYMLRPDRWNLDVLPDKVHILQRQKGSGMLLSRVLEKLRKTHPSGNFLEGDRYVNIVGQQIMHHIFGKPAEVYQHGMERHLTTGLHGIVIAASLCTEVRTYGFVKSAFADSAPYHYYGARKKGTANDKGKHSTYLQEKQLWRMMATNGDVDSTDKAVFPGFNGIKCSLHNSYNSLLQQL
mmetsp:Transcript_60800/g.144878  ORF Transcript_60800/g.144878 Transcript_60800/m.144878 type:complete len:348 (-) Transcript_60800:97-1140(-)